VEAVASFCGVVDGVGVVSFDVGVSDESSDDGGACVWCESCDEVSL